MTPGSVRVAYVHPNEVSSSFVHSLLRMIEFDRKNHGLIGGWMDTRYSHNIATSRNMIANNFLALYSDAQWLLMVDADMGFTEDALYRLLAVADPDERPVVGALCFTSREVALDGAGGMRAWPQSTIFDFEGGRMKARTLYPVSSVTECDATGAAFLLIHRSVLEKLPAGDWFEPLPGPDGTPYSEDISFCARVRALEIPIYVNTAVRTTHHKSVWLSEVDFWQQYLPEPADERVDVVVPVRGRPASAGPFMRSLRASTGLARVLVVADDDDPDTFAAWADGLLSEGDRVIRAPRMTAPQKWNLGYGAAGEDVGAAPWVLMVGDDVRFHPGWLDHAQAIARSTGARVIGTNDLGNPRVMEGTHATHLLIRRNYIDEVGASWGGSGVLCHEGYGHNFCDDEIVTAAKRRGEWAMALGAIIEHRHPLWGRADDDEVYRIGRSTFETDRLRFQRRYSEHGYPEKALELAARDA